MHAKTKLPMEIQIQPLQIQLGDDGVDPVALLLLGHASREPQEGGEYERLLHRQLWEEDIVLSHKSNPAAGAQINNTKKPSQ
jgi:hypothetical protein